MTLPPNLPSAPQTPFTPRRPCSSKFFQNIVSSAVSAPSRIRRFPVCSTPPEKEKICAFWYTPFRTAQRELFLQCRNFRCGRYDCGRNAENRKKRYGRKKEPAPDWSGARSAFRSVQSARRNEAASGTAQSRLQNPSAPIKKEM